MVRHGLSRVDHDDRADRVRRGGDLRDRRHRSRHVRLVADRDDLRPLADQRADVGQVDPAIAGDREPAQGSAGALAQLLPGDQVGVVLELGDQDLVARPDRERGGPGRRGVADRVGDQVGGLGGVPGEDDLAGIGSDEGGDPRPGALEGIGRLLAEQVRAPVGGGVARDVVRALGVEHRPSASARSRPSRGRSAGCRRAPTGSGSGSRRGSPRRPGSCRLHPPRRPPRSARSRWPQARRPVRGRPRRRSCRRRRRARSRAARSAGSWCSA